MLVRYRQPWYLSSRVNSEFDQLMAETFGREVNTFTPAADIATEGQDVLITLAVPGIAAEAIDVTLEGRRLTISGERAKSEVAEGDRFISRGLRRGTFNRGFTVPQGTTAEQVSASLDNGLLTVRVAQVTKPAPEPQKIAVSSVISAKAEIETAEEK